MKTEDNVKALRDYQIDKQNRAIEQINIIEARLGIPKNIRLDNLEELVSLKKNLAHIANNIDLFNTVLL